MMMKRRSPTRKQSTKKCRLLLAHPTLSRWTSARTNKKLKNSTNLRSFLLRLRATKNLRKEKDRRANLWRAFNKLFLPSQVWRKKLESGVLNIPGMGLRPRIKTLRASWSSSQTKWFRTVPPKLWALFSRTNLKSSKPQSRPSWTIFKCLWPMKSKSSECSCSSKPTITLIKSCSLWCG